MYLKKEVRLLGIDDSPFDKFKDKEVLVVGVILMGGEWMDGVLSAKVKVDGSEATETLIKIINRCKFKPQLRAILLNGIAVAGFNIIDIKKLSQKTKTPVITIIRKMPDIGNIKKVLKKINKSERIRWIDKAGKPIKIGKIYCQFTGCSLDYVKRILKISCTRSLIPEPIRVAHLIATGIVKGESKGNA
jgi:endonuclease V-like protein UPF0215 family